MHLVIDAQSLQTSSWQRGIGRYCKRFIAAYSLEFPGDQISLLVNRFSAPKWTTELRQFVSQELGANATLHSFGPSNPYAVQFPRKRSIAELDRHAKIQALNADAILTLSLFQHKRDVILPVSESERRIPSFAILYDLIPLQLPNEFLHTPSQRIEYRHSLEVMQAMDGLLSISMVSTQAWREMFNQHHLPIATIGGAPDQTQISAWKGGFEERSGVLCLSGETPNKNLPALIDAYSLLPVEVRNEHPLTILGIRSRGFRKGILNAYRSVAETIRIPGYVSDDKLSEFLVASRVLVAPSSVEGLGLPVFEAYSNGVPIVVTRGTSMAEYVPSEDTTFELGNPEDLASKVYKLLTHEEAWFQALENQISFMRPLSWAQVARRAREFLVQESMAFKARRPR